MYLSLLMLVLCLSPTEVEGRMAPRQPGLWYSVPPEQREEAPSQARAAQRSSLGRPRTSRALLGGGVTISTLPDNVTRVVEDSSQYYTWRMFGPKDQRTHQLWVDMSDPQHGQVRMHGILSNAHKQAAKVAMSFDFPFYGHYLRQITIATGGFIFMGDITHRMLTTTQYIAPLMANFDPGYSKESTVKYLDNGEVFIVQWDKVRLQGQESSGAFSFQAALYKTGSITFSYRFIPLPVPQISSADHPVKAGLSDAFMVTSPSSDAKRRTLFEYHRVEIDTRKVTNLSVIEFTPLPTCLQHSSCELCTSSNQTSGCSWCHVLQRCSDGMDRHRQEWLEYGCSEESKDATCEDYSRDNSDSSIAPPVTPPAITTLTPPHKGCGSNDVKTHSSTRDVGGANMEVIVGITAALVLVLALILVALYINYHPHTVAPHYLIQRRKSNLPSFKFQNKGFHSNYTEVDGEGNERYSIIEGGPY